MERKPFHEVIIGEMKETAKLVAASAGAEDQMKCFGDIFRKAILPKDKKSEIADAIRTLAKNFPNMSNDTASAQHYLEALAEDIGE